MPITVAIADSQYLIRVGLMHLLNTRDEVTLVGEASDQKGLYELVEQQQPDVLIFDYNKPQTFDKEDLVKVKKLSSKTGFLIISADDNRQSIFAVLEKGVTSFLTKECDEEEIFKAIKATSRGEKFFCSKVLDFLLQKSLGNEPENCYAVPLTTREIEIVKFISEGKTAKEIAEEINISIHTIYTHRKNIMKKLKMNSTSELVLYAVRNGIVDSSN